MVKLTAEDGYSAQRSYSITSAPEPSGTSGTIEIAIEKLHDGEVSPFFHDIVIEGDEIELGGPIGGHFLWDAAGDGPALLIAGGSGIAPFMSMLRHRAAISSRTPTALIFSARTLDELLYRDALADLAAAADGFDLAVTLTRETAPHPFRLGRITPDLVQTVVSRMGVMPEHVLVCGSNQFVDAAVDGALSTGIQARWIKTERYGI